MVQLYLKIMMIVTLMNLTLIHLKEALILTLIQNMMNQHKSLLVPALPQPCCSSLHDYVDIAGVRGDIFTGGSSDSDDDVLDATSFCEGLAD